MTELLPMHRSRFLVRFRFRPGSVLFLVEFGWRRVVAVVLAVAFCLETFIFVWTTISPQTFLIWMLTTMWWFNNVYLRLKGVKMLFMAHFQLQFPCQRCRSPFFCLTNVLAGAKSRLIVNTFSTSFEKPLLYRKLLWCGGPKTVDNVFMSKAQHHLFNNAMKFRSDVDLSVMIGHSETILQRLLNFHCSSLPTVRGCFGYYSEITVLLRPGLAVVVVDSLFKRLGSLLIL